MMAQKNKLSSDDTLLRSSHCFSIKFLLFKSNDADINSIFLEMKSKSTNDRSRFKSRHLQVQKIQLLRDSC